MKKVIATAVVVLSLSILFLTIYISNLHSGSELIESPPIESDHVSDVQTESPEEDGTWSWPINATDTWYRPFGPITQAISGEKIFLDDILILGKTIEGADVLAVCPGTVTAVGYNESEGNYVRIKNKQGLEISYRHLATTAVLDGDAVMKEAIIGTVGSTGTLRNVLFDDTASGLGLAVYDGDTPVDPVPLLESVN